MADIRDINLYRRREAADTIIPGAIMDTARVVKREDGGFLLVTPDTLALRGRKAAGCLLEPEENDTVLIARNTSSGVYILTVLERGESPGRIVLPTDTTMATSGGSLKLAGAQATVIESPQVTLSGARGDLTFAELELTAGTTRARSGRLSLVAATIDTVAERITQRVRDCFRRVSRMDSTKAGQVRISAESRFSVTAGDAALTAQRDVKIDGDKIRLG